MKKNILCHMLTCGITLLMTAAAAFPALAADYSGALESATADAITGWAWDSEAPDTPVTVELTFSGQGGPGETQDFTVTADQPMSDGSKHGFTYQVDWSAHKGDSITVLGAIVSGEKRIPFADSITYNKKSKTALINERTADPKGSDSSAASDETGSIRIIRVSDTDASGTNSDTASGKYAGTKRPEASVSTAVQGDKLGTFTVSGYCSCTICTKGSGLTYSGTKPKANHTIAADLSIFPLGTKLMIDGIVYTVEDMGSGIDGNRIDIYFDTHAEALACGYRTVDVYAVK